MVFFCVCFGLFECSVKLKETAIEQEGYLHLFKIITSGRHLWPGHPPQEVLV